MIKNAYHVHSLAYPVRGKGGIPSAAAAPAVPLPVFYRIETIKDGENPFGEASADKHSSPPPNQIITSAGVLERLPQCYRIVTAGSYRCHPGILLWRGGTNLLLACLKNSFAVLAFILAVALPIQAQLSTASINGQLRDESGQAVPNAAILLHNVETGVDRRTESNEIGGYLFIDVASGKYTLEASHVGFSTSRVETFTLTVNQTATIAITLGLGTSVRPSQSTPSETSCRARPPN
jgi:hypothetical protein